MKQLCDALEYLVRLSEQEQEHLHSYIEESPVENPKRRCSIFGLCKHDRSIIKIRDIVGPPKGTSSFSKLGWYSLGDFGLWSIDFMMMILLLSIAIAFEVAILSFAEATPFTTGGKMLDGIILALILVPLCIVDDMSALSKLSRLGLIILGLTMAVVGWYGLAGHHDIEYAYAGDTIDGGENYVDNYDANKSPFNLFPLNGIEGVSKWFGCVVFSFGVVPLTFNFRESMAEPEKLPQTALISMLLVGVCYIIIGVSFLYLFPNVENDILAEIPSTGLLATGVRLAMIVVTMATTPLLVVPCAEIIEGKIMKNEDGQTIRSKKLMIIIRTFLLLVTVSVAIKLPGFVSVLAFVGCFAVSTVSFVLPPALHWLLLSQGIHDGPGGKDYSLWSSIRDLSILLVGLLTTIVTTWFTGGS